MYGRVRMYNAGFLIFTIASILLSLTPFTGSQGALWLIGFRVVQGVGGALLLANSTAILTDAFPAEQRGLALGVNQVAGIAGSFLGLVVGGVLAPVNWRLIFLVSVPVGLFGTIWAYVKLRETREVVLAGADEVDMVIDRGAFLSGRYAKVFDEVVRVKDACGDAHLKAILEVAELGTYDNVRRASLLAMAAGADFIKTSTGKLPGAATLPVQLVMLEAIRDVFDETGRRVGMKAAGGIRTAKQAIQYLVQVHETLGPDWLTPDLYRIGASSVVNDILMQLRKERTGAYQSKDYFTND